MLNKKNAFRVMFTARKVKRVNQYKSGGRDAADTFFLYVAFHSAWNAIVKFFD